MTGADQQLTETDIDAVAKQISALEARRCRAMTDADIATLEELLSPDLTSILVRGDCALERETGHAAPARVAGPASAPRTGL